MKPRFALPLASALLHLATASGVSEPMGGDGFRISSAVVGAAGSSGASGSLRLRGTLAQSTPVGRGTTENTGLRPGFWESWPFGMAPAGLPDGGVPPTHRVRKSFPNPFLTSTSIEYGLAAASPVEIRVFDIQGRAVRTLARGETPAGWHRAVWDGRNEDGQRLGSGPYFCSVRIGGRQSVLKILLVN